MAMLLALALVAQLALVVGGAQPAAAQPAQDRIVSAVPGSFTPNIDNGLVNAITQVGNRIIVGGTFTSVTKSGTSYPRNYIFAFDATTGAIDTGFVPLFN